MRVFVSGATGFIGTALIKELRQSGHQVLGLARTETSAEALRAAGVEPRFGTLEEPEALAAAAAEADGVIHLAFNHDFSRWAGNSAIERRAIERLGAELAGTGKKLVVTSGVFSALTPGRLTLETDPPNSPIPRVASEHAAAAMARQNVNIIIMRLPQVHDPLKQGLITPLALIAKEKGLAAYIGDGSNRWAAGHLSDVARLYRLALENGTAGAIYHAVGEEGVPMKAIAEAIGKGLSIPVRSIPEAEAEAHFGWLSQLAAADAPASSAYTREVLGWTPTGPTLLDDLNEGRFAGCKN